MEPFKINCVTCQAALSVRSESIVGQIIACPKCGSMVEIHPPTATEPVGGEADSPVAEMPSVLDSQSAASGFPIVALSGGLLVLGVMAIAAVAFWPSDSEDLPPEVASVTESVPQPSPEPVANQETQPLEPPQQEVAFEETDKAPEIEPAKQEVVPATKPDLSLSEQTEPISVEPPVADVARVARREESKPGTARQFDALDFDPESLDLETLSESKPEAKETKIEMPARPQVGNVQANPVREPQQTTLPLVRRGKLPEQGAITRDAREQFARKLPALKFREMPLVEFLQLVSQLGGVPVTVDAEQLLMAGISARERVSLDAKDVTLDAALAEVLKSLRLEHGFQGPHVTIFRQDAKEMREIDYPLDDVISSAHDGEELVGQIKQLVAPSTWDSASVELEGKTLAVTQSQQVHYELLVFLERLRIVNGKRTRSRFPVERLAPTPLHAAMAARLTGPALFTFTKETPLAEVVRHWQRELDVPILVDWVALAELGLWPEATIVCAVSDRNWEQALTEVLEPLGLDWRVSFGGTIEISSVEDFVRQPQLELYSLGGNTTASGPHVVEALAEHLSSVKGAGLDQVGTALLFDPQSSVVFARQPASVQREILQWLE